MKEETVRFGRCEWRPAQRRLTVDGAPAPLGARALDLLAALVEGRDRVLTKAELLERVWPGMVVEEANLPVQVSALRRHLGADAIATVAGRGYRFVAPVQRVAGAGDGPGAPTDPHAVPAGGARPRAAEEPPTPQVPATADAARAAPAVASAEAAADAAADPLIGRDDERRALAAQVSARRLVSVVGEGGVGKTRLARAVADALAGRWPDGTAWVDVADVLDGTRLPQAVAQVLRLGPVRDAAALAAALAHHELLLVLDNCEHVADAVAALARAFAAAPGVHLLVTSQLPLAVDGESVLRLPPLPLPAEGDPADARFGAVALFVRRAQAADPSFALDAGNAPAVAEICHRLDGLPLGLELAAARVGTLGVQALAARLGERLLALAGGATSPLQRHLSLTAALQWSHSLLEPVEQAVLRRLGVCVGGFTPDLAAAVVQGPGVDAPAAVAALGTLQARSLVHAGAGADGRPRLRLLEAVRLFALQRLAEAGERAPTRQRHARAVAERLGVLDRGRFGDAGPLSTDDVMRPLRAELANVRAAIAFALEDGDRPLAVELAGTASVVFVHEGLVSELLPTMQALLPHVHEASPAARVRLLWRLGAFGRQLLMDGATLQQLKEQALAEARTLGDRRRLHALLGSVGFSLAGEGRLAEAEAVTDEMAALEAMQDPPYLPALRLLVATRIAESAGRLDEAVARSLEQRALLEQAPGESMARLVCDANLSIYLVALGRFDEAVAIGRAAMALADAPRLFHQTVYLLVLPLAALGHVDEARSLLQAHRRALAREEGSLVRFGFEALAMLAAARGDAPAALRILAEQLRRSPSPDALTVRVRGHVLARCSASAVSPPGPGTAPLGAPALLALALGEDEASPAGSFRTFSNA